MRLQKIVIVWMFGLLPATFGCNSTSSGNSQVKDVASDVPNTPVRDVRVPNIKLAYPTSEDLPRFGYKPGSNCFLYYQGLTADGETVSYFNMFSRPCDDNTAASQLSDETRKSLIAEIPIVVHQSIQNGAVTRLCTTANSTGGCGGVVIRWNSDDSSGPSMTIDLSKCDIHINASGVIDQFKC